MNLKFFDAHNILPEYFVISVPLFDDVVKDELDEWLYMMKHAEVKADFKSPYMKKVAERLNILKMTPTERKKYATERNKTLKERDYIVSAEEKGREEGDIAARQDIARAMLAKKMDPNVVAQITGLDLEAIAKLAN
jgi:predicted transposase/invertase (TIGR01784 family)